MMSMCKNARFIFILIWVWLTFGIPQAVLADEISAPSQGAGILVATLPTSTPRPFVPLVTSTPLPDGRIVHVVASGDSLWSIAVSYDVTMDEIRGLNSLPAGSTAIQIGQKLVIRVAFATVIVPSGTPSTQDATGTLTATFTRLPPTQTQTLNPSETLTQTMQPSATQTPLPQVSLVIDRRSIGIALIVICAIGLLVVGLTGFRKR
jgi:LysM repeat protein